MSPVETPQTIGRYRILQPLGEGGMGTVYLAEDPRIGRRLAIKTVRLSNSSRDVEENQKRLLMEARAAGRLLHPNVVTLFDADEVDGLLFLAFEYVPGVDLSRRLANDPPLTLRQVLHLLREIASALDQAHQAGIVHRDIKPSNVLISLDGTAKVADFGLAKLKNESLELTRTGSVLGSPQYMSPEQVRGEPLDGRCDLFSLGVLAYEMLSRMRPFGGETISTLVFEILSKEPMALDHLRPGLPRRLVKLVHDMLAKDLVSRTYSATAVINEVDAVLRETPAAELDALAVPPLDDGAPTRLMATGAPSPPSPPPAPHLPTATIPSALAPPPPPPGLPPAGLPQAVAAPHPTTSIASAVAAPGGRRTSTAGAAAMVALVLALMAVLGGTGWWLLNHFGAAKGPTTPPESSVASTDEDASRANGSADQQAPPEQGSIAAVSTDDSTTGDPSTGDSTAGTKALPGTSPPSLREPQDPSSTGTSSGAQPTRQPRQQQQTRQSPTLGTSRPTSLPPASATAPSIRPPRAGQDTSTEENRPRPLMAPHLAAFDRAASRAQREIECGRFLVFQVEPKEALVRVWRRGDRRQRVMGQAHAYSPKNRKGGSLELPESGQYLITLVAEGYPDFVIYALAKDGGSPTPQRIQVALRVASTRSGVERIQVTRGLAFKGSPKAALIYLNGTRQGPASRWPGGGRPGGVKNLRLTPGLHRIRIEAPGYRPYAFEVEVTPNARRRVRTIEYALRR